MGQSFDVRRGLGLALEIQLRGPDGLPLTNVYSGSETLAARVWPGDDRAVVATPSAAWVSGPAGTVRLTLTGAQATVLDLGRNLVELLITDGGDQYPAWEGVFRVLDAPGLATAPATLCTLGDVLSAAGELADDLAERSDQAGLAEARHAAWLWTRRTLLSRARTVLERQRGQHGAVVEVDPIEPAAGVDSGPAWGESIYPDTTVRDQLDDLADHFDASKLMADSEVIQANAHFALYRIFARQITASEGSNAYRSLARDHRITALRLMAGSVLRLDTDDDGAADYEFASV